MEANNGVVAAEVVVLEEVVVEAAEAEKSEPAVEAAPVAEEPNLAKPPRVCKICGHPSGNSVGKIKLGRLIEVEEGGLKLLAFEPVCDPCSEAMPDAERKKLRKIGFLYGFVGDQNRETREFAAAKAYWAAVIAGKAERMPEVRKTPEGMLSCGVPECVRCHDKSDHKVESFVVMAINGKLTLFGICGYQFAALRDSEIEEPRRPFTTPRYGLAKRLIDEENAKVAAFAAAKDFWTKVADDEAKVEVRVEWPESGDPVYRCGVPDCGCRKRGDRPVDHFVVQDGQKDAPIAGVCGYQFAALKQSGVKLFAAGNGDGTGLARCEKHRRWLMRSADNAARAVQGRPPRPPRPQDFDKIGGGLARFRSPAIAAKIREEKRETREEVERRREERRARLAAAIGRTNHGQGKRHKGGQKGSNGGGKDRRRH